MGKGDKEDDWNLDVLGYTVPVLDCANRLIMGNTASDSSHAFGLTLLSTIYFGIYSCVRL